MWYSHSDLCESRSSFMIFQSFCKRKCEIDIFLISFKYEFQSHTMANKLCRKYCIHSCWLFKLGVKKIFVLISVLKYLLRSQIWTVIVLCLIVNMQCAPIVTNNASYIECQIAF